MIGTPSVTVPPVPPKTALLFPLTHAVLAPPVAAVSQFVIVVFHVPVPPLAFAAGFPPSTVPPSPNGNSARPPGRRRDQAVGQAGGAGRPRLGPARTDLGAACSATLQFCRHVPPPVSGRLQYIACATDGRITSVRGTSPKRSRDHGPKTARASGRDPQPSGQPAARPYQTRRNPNLPLSEFRLTPSMPVT